MCHSIESNEIPAVTGSFPIKMERFKNQLLTLKELGYEFDYISNLHKKNKDNRKLVYITGDDGTIDWTRNALPWCEENKIPTHTGIITGPFEKEAIYPLTHLIQIILITRNPTQLEKLSENLQANFLTKDQVDYIDKLYFYEELEYRRIIKGAFNLILDKNEAYNLIGKFSNNEEELLKSRFEKIDYYKQFEYVEVGVHTRSHWALGKEKDDYITNEIEESKNFLLKNELTPTDYFVSPMKPRYGASLEDISDDLKKLGYKGILDSNPGIWDNTSFIIPRIDVINVEEFFNFKK